MAQNLNFIVCFIKTLKFQERFKTESNFFRYRLTFLPKSFMIEESKIGKRKRSLKK
ncbi:hypothetical protein LEP1GSC082_0984 [Leptospira kirschneri str. H2]|nr:hypothetical protein LEP1GSC082_0984 [Leptospira kirschneri str. H2]